MPPIPLLLSAGETSGDMYAARLATALRSRLDVALFGMGGQQMRAAGVDVVADYSEVSVVGITEILSHLPSLVRAMRCLVSEAERLRHPDGFSRLPSAPRSKAAAAWCPQHLLHLPAVLGVAAMASARSTAQICAGPVHLSF